MTKSRQAKSPAANTAAKHARTKNGDPRLPAVGTTIVRPNKGTEHRIKVLEDGFELDGKETFRSLTGLARRVTGHAATSGPAWVGLTKEAAKEVAPEETPAAPKKRASSVRRAARDPQPELAATVETAESGSEATSA